MIYLDSIVVCDECGDEQNSVAQIAMIATSEGNPSHTTVIPGFPDGWAIHIKSSRILTSTPAGLEGKIAQQLCSKCQSADKVTGFEGRDKGDKTERNKHPKKAKK